MTQHAHRGVTLIEMMIVIAILSILAAIAVPGFSNLITSNQIAGSISDFVGALRRAKTEASAKRIPVTICIRNGNTCNISNGAAWNDGWLVFLDNDGDAIIDTGDTIIYEQEALGRQITFSGTGSAARRIIFSPSGTTNLTDQETFAMCDGNKVIRRGLSITVAGHASPLNTIAAGNCP